MLARSYRPIFWGPEPNARRSRRHAPADLECQHGCAHLNRSFSNVETTARSSSPWCSQGQAALSSDSLGQRGKCASLPAHRGTTAAEAQLLQSLTRRARLETLVRRSAQELSLAGAVAVSGPSAKLRWQAGRFRPVGRLDTEHRNGPLNLGAALHPPLDGEGRTARAPKHGRQRSRSREHADRDGKPHPQ
jgi:hypothetical protein